MNTNEIKVGETYVLNGINGLRGAAIKVSDVNVQRVLGTCVFTQRPIRTVQRRLKRVAVKGVDY